MINPIQMPRHAERRCCQRGVRSSVVRTLIECHDADIAVGGNCRALRVSRRMLSTLKSEGIDPQQIERLKRLVVIWSDRNAQVVTVFRDSGHRSARRYRANNLGA